ncbi:xin actin-binding repeat-containing protein 2 [Spea bombifrons]|uniref:xin actin-binding repeat-containing protein 2 n=1 Tax=Spea bombifrons TaxID=233779 RepID=UPI00234B4C96|nr:xin actin-binding repeat-containing protein 2 [Spea bombifrons]
MALYQAAVSNKSHSSVTNAVEESETRAVPGGLAKMKEQFEKSNVALSHSAVTQYQYQQRAVKEMRQSNEVTFMSSSQANEQHTSQSQSQFTSFNTAQVSALEQSTHEKHTASNYSQAADGVDYKEIPKISAQVVKEQFERPSKEKSTNPSGASVTRGKNTKIYNDYPEFEWPVVHSNINDSSSRVFESTSATTSTKHTSSASAGSLSFGSLEEFPPPPPPDILDTAEMAEFSQSPEALSASERHASTAPKELYSKQRNLYELKRLYKHIHPELRKNLEQEYISAVSDIITSQCDQKDMKSNDVQQVKYAFENARDSPQKCISPEREYLEWDEILKGEVQSMRWVFENQPLDSIKDESQEPSHIKSIGEQEIIAGGDVKYTTWMFETQPIHALSTDISDSPENVEKVPDLARGDVRTATWLFETQPLDSLNKIYKENDSLETTNAVEDIRGGDVKTARYLYETQVHDENVSSVYEHNMLTLRSELQEIRGDVKRTVKQFETEPKYVLKDSSGKVLEIKTVCKEDIEKGDVKTARWMFETQPLDTINQDEVQVKVVRGISMEESVKGGVGKAKWLFETQPLDSIKEETSITEKEAVIGADVYQKCWIFETIPMDMLKDKANERPLQEEEIIGGNVSSAKHLFETVPMDMLKESTDVNKLKQVITTEEEKGDVRHQRWVFETKPLEQIREEKKDHIRTVQLEEIHKGDVSGCKSTFERADWEKMDFSSKVQVGDFAKGSVQLNRKLFETTPLYAIQDRLGHYHKVQTIRQEEIVRGDVRSCQWMFETIPIDQFGDDDENYQIIKGISSQEIVSGDVKTAKWLFETQPLDSIKYFSNVEDEETTRDHQTDIVKGDVKMCKWLFETQAMEDLYDKDAKMTNSVDIQKGDVKTCTWLFETQPLDSIQESPDKDNEMYKRDWEKIQGRDVQTACLLFETQNLENIQGGETKDFKRVVEIDVQSGDVSTMKYIFENQPLDKISLSSEEVLQKIKSMKCEDLQNGNVLNCRWLFENHSMDKINENVEENKSSYAIKDVQGGNVKKGCFIFETFSLDQIKDSSFEESSTRTVNKDEIIKGDVKNYTMMFETQPLYAIQDKEGHLHEVTTVKKEEVSHGNVRGTRWLFETRPLDSFNETSEVFLIKAVTQEDIEKGDFNSVRWRFETQPLDTISDDVKARVKTIDDVQGGNVEANKQLFENKEDKDQFVRTVSISEIQQGNVKTSTWLFETHNIDEIHRDGYQNIKTVTMEDIHKGDVQEAVWLFENQNLDSIREDEENARNITKEEIPQTDVRTTTWLFETTPLHEFNEYKVERQEVIGKSIQETLKELYSQKIVESHGIILETDEIGDIRMAKYHLMNPETPVIQKEDVIRGDLQNIMMNLLSQNTSTERMVLLNEEEKGNVTLTKSHLLNQSTEVQVQKEDIVGGDIQEAIKKLFNDKTFEKQGILIQESEKGDIKMTVYSLFNRSDNKDFQREEVLGVDIKRAISNLKSSAVANETLERVKIEDSERGNVQFYTTCIESGALDYLKRLQQTSDDVSEKENEEIIGGDVEGTKLLLKRQLFQVERTIDETDIIPGDVYNTTKVFMTVPENKSLDANKEEIVKGNLRETLNSLNQAINQTVCVEKEEIIKADLTATLKSLTDSQNQVRDIEKQDIIPGDIQGTINSLEKAINIKTEYVKEDVIRGNLDATLKSLKEAQQSIKQSEKESVIKGDVSATVQTLLDASTEKKNVQHKVIDQGDVKGTLKTLLQPTFQTVQRKASVEGNVKDTIKNLMQLNEETQIENKHSSTRGISGEQINYGGQTDQYHATKIDGRNQQSIHSSQQNLIEASDTLVDNVTMKNEKAEISNISGHNIYNKAMFCSDDEKILHQTKSESLKAWKKHKLVTGDQAAEPISAENTYLLQGFSDECKEKTSTELIDQNKVMQNAKMSSSINTSKYTASQQPINVINRGSRHTSDNVHKEVKKQQIQHYRKTKDEINVQRAQVLDSINNNVDNARNLQIIKDKNVREKETEKTQTRAVKEMKSFQEKSKTVSTREDQACLTTNYSGSAKKSKEEKKSETYLPPPLPPVSSNQFLPPPPPPLANMPSFKMSGEQENFPLPPPPVLDNGFLPPPPPETPPLTIEYIELANRKMNIESPQQRTSHSEQLQSHSKSQMTASDQTYVSGQPSKSRLPNLKPNIKEMSVTKVNQKQNIHKESTISEYMQKVSTSHSSTDRYEQQAYDHKIEVINQGALLPKKKEFVSPRTSSVSNTNIPSTKTHIKDIAVTQVNESVISKDVSASVTNQKVRTSESNAQNFNHLKCEQELKQVKNESLKAKKNVCFSPKAENSPIKTKVIDISVAQVGEPGITSRTQETSSESEHKGSTVQLKYEDFDQFMCDQELEGISEETLKPKKRVSFSPNMSPASETVSTPKPKTEEAVSIQRMEHKLHNMEVKNYVGTQNETEQDFDQECDRELEKIHEQTLKPQKNVFLPPRASPALTTETTPTKPKTYVRKFKTPLMIAEEKYRQQREEMEKNKQKAVYQVVNTSTMKSETNHITEDLKVDQSASKVSLEMSMASTKKLDHDKIHLNARENVISDEDSLLWFDRSKHDSALLASPKLSNFERSAASSNEEHVRQEKRLDVVKEKKTEHTFNKSQRSNKVDELTLVKEKTDVKHLNKNIENIQQEMNVKQIHSVGNTRQNESSATQMKQRKTEASHKVCFNEKQQSHELKAQSISHNSEQQQQQLGRSGNIEEVCNELETQKEQTKHTGITITKAEGTASPEILKKHQVKINKTIKQENIESQGQSEKRLPIHQTPKVFFPKHSTQESKAISQNTVIKRQVQETTAKTETSEKKQSLPVSQIKEEPSSTEVLEYIRRCEELQQTLTKAKKIESNPQSLNIYTFTTFLNIVPNWLISQEKKKDMANLAASNSPDDITKQMSYIKRQVMDMQSSFESQIHSVIKSSSTASRHESSSHSGLSQKQISAISRKVDKTNQVQEKSQKIGNEFGRLSSDFRACSPSLRMRSPSPTYITIESTARRTESPQNGPLLSQSPLPKEPVTAPLPPRRSMTPKMTSPSPTPQKNRSEQLAKLKDTTAKLSHGPSQARSVTPIPVVIEKKCEIIHSPASLRRQLKIENHATGSVCITPTPVSEIAVSTVEDRTELYEEARMSEVHKPYSQKDPTHIPVWPSPDMDSLDVILVAKKFEVPTSSERRDAKVYTREGANSYEKSVIGSKAEIHRAGEVENKNFRTTKGTFHTEQKKILNPEIKKCDPQMTQAKSTPHDDMKGKTRTVPIRQLKDPKENTSKQIFVSRQHETKEHILKPMLHSESISITEQVSGADQLKSKVGRTRTSLNSESMKSGFEFKHAPPTYEDVISGHMLDISATESPEEILKNFQKTWKESERVFQSLGYTVSDTSEMRSSFHQEEFITENATSGQGSLHCLSTEGLSNGMPSHRQTDLS